MKNIIQKIHESKVKLVLAITGGGTEAIGELLRYGGGSSTVLEAIIPYCQKSFEEFIGGTPDQFVSANAACNLAMAAFQRGLEFASSQETIGIGSTSSLAKSNERAGRKHNIWIATQTTAKTTCRNVDIPDNLTREEEEKIVSDAILHEIAVACGVLDSTFASRKTYEINEGKQDLFTGKKAIAGFSPTSNEIIFPGSFNPIHPAHLKMIDVASLLAKTEFSKWGRGWENIKEKVNLEISIQNVDKPMLHYKSVIERMEDFRSNYNTNMGELIFTNARRFYHKVQLFPNCAFVVGIDTFIRLVERKYYQNEDEFKFATNLLNQAKWIVFPRNDFHKSMDDFLFTKMYIADCYLVPTEHFPVETYNHSSREIRKS